MEGGREKGEENTKEGREMVNVLVSKFKPIVGDVRFIVGELRKLLGTGALSRATLGLEDHDAVQPIALGSSGSRPPATPPPGFDPATASAAFTLPPGFAFPLTPVARPPPSSTTPPSTSTPVLHPPESSLTLDDTQVMLHLPLSNVRTTARGQMMGAAEITKLMRLELKALVKHRVKQ